MLSALNGLWLGIVKIVRRKNTAMLLIGDIRGKSISQITIHTFYLARKSMHSKAKVNTHFQCSYPLNIPENQRDFNIYSSRYTDVFHSFSLRLPTCPLVLEGLARAVGIHRVTWMTTWHQDYPPHQWCRAKWAMVRFFVKTVLSTKPQDQDPPQCCHLAPCSDCCLILARMHACLELSLWFLLLSNLTTMQLSLHDVHSWILN